MKKVQTNLNSRIEERYIILDTEKYFDILNKQGFKEQKYSDKNIVLTIYFNVPSDPLPLAFSIKARRYMSNKILPVVLNEKDEFFFEIKTTIGFTSKKEKTRYSGSFAEILSYAKQEYHPDIQPVLAIQYERTHYTKNSNEEIRITIDSQVEFFLFEESVYYAKYIGSENNGRRLEIKAVNQHLINEFLPVDINRYPVISKGLSGFNFMSNAQEARYAKSRFEKEIPGVELESKLVTLKDDQIFNSIKKSFDFGFDNYKTDYRYPYINNSASINRYLQDNVHTNLRACMCDSRVKITTKNQGEFVKNPYGLDCILKRNENKGFWCPIWGIPEMNYPILGELLRIRRAFWLINEKTGRVYHISYDIAYNSIKNLCQIETEYTGRIDNENFSRSSNPEKLIIEDISLITQFILNNFDVRQSDIQKNEFFSSV